MKTKLAYYLIFVLILFSSCKNGTENKSSLLKTELNQNPEAKQSQSLLKNCDECRTTRVEKPDLPNSTNLTLRIDYKNEENYQPFQYDLLNGYGIVGKLEMNGRKVKDIKFNLFEVGDCKRYFVKKATYEGHNKEDDIHKIKFEIAKYIKSGNRPDADLDFGGKEFKIKPGQILNVQIRSKDFPELNAPPVENGISKDDLLNDPDYAVMIFPPFICQGKFVGGNGN
tara:strand:+ start:7446 stop:8123 length:678 start_codon:yes stop_codon:yes gene_type:complete